MYLPSWVVCASRVGGDFLSLYVELYGCAPKQRMIVQTVDVFVIFSAFLVALVGDILRRLATDT